MGSIDSSLEEAAENLGSSKLQRLMKITLPVIMPSIAAGAIMVFMTSLADFGTPMLIGEGYTVLPVLVYNEYMSEMGGNAYLASALSVIVVLCSSAVLLVQKYYVSRKNYDIDETTRRNKSTWMEKILDNATCNCCYIYRDITSNCSGNKQFYKD